MNTTDYLPLPLPDNDLPPLPGAGEYGPQVCETIQLYLAILDDLSPDQVQQVLEHVRSCANCAAAQRLMQQTTQVFARLPASTPSERVDQAIMAAIARRGNTGVASHVQDTRSTVIPLPILSGRRKSRPYPMHSRILVKRSRSWLGAVAAVVLAAVLMLSLVTTLHFLGGPAATQGFALPATLTWDSYVLYHSETRLDNKGERYRIETYHDMSTGRMHVETTMPGSLDVVAIGTDHSILGLDMMHHVAQWGADDWNVDDSAFDLAELRNDLHTQIASYLGKDFFHGQPVYRVRSRNGLVLLLSMDYKPVNVLRGAVDPGTGEPVYDTLLLMLSSQVAKSMWKMSVPTGYRMGKLPTKP